MLSTPPTKRSMQHSKAHRFLIHTAATFALLTLFAGLFGTFALSAHAQSVQTGNPPGSSVTTGNPPGQQTGGQTLVNPLKYDTLDSLLTAVLKAAIQIGSIVLTLALVWVGFKFVAARGNEEKIRAAKTALMWTIIGGLILLGATAIQTVITSTVSNITS